MLIDDLGDVGALNAAVPHLLGVDDHRHAPRALVEAPGGAHPTSCVPDYGRDEAFQRQYVEDAQKAVQR